jgi:copper chaperone CopZ
MTTTKLTIERLDGPTDSEHLQKALEAVPRVESVEIDHAARQALISHAGADPLELVSAVAAVGYPARLA